MTHLLSTSTPGYQELVGNGKTFRVPPFQRDYSWTKEQWEDLWEDIDELRTELTRRHYMGAIVVKPESDRSFLVIDGQQRLATLGILSLAVISRLHSLAQSGIEPDDNQERAVQLRAIFTGSKDPASLLEISKLRLNDHDDGFYQDFLVQLRRPLNPRSLKRSNKLLWECFEYFEHRLAEDCGLANDGSKLAGLLSEVVSRQLLFILITVTDEISAYTVFETLNARGLELTTTDLLKTYLFSKLKAASDLESVQRRWQTLTTTVRQERFASFIRYHYLTRHRKIRSSRLFKLVRDEVKSSVDVLELIQALESRAELFDALSDPNHSYWLDLPEAKPFIRQLRLFRVQQMTPLLFVAKEHFSGQDFVKTLKLVCTMTFRYTIVSGRNPNELEPAYHDAAKAILDGSAAHPGQVFRALRSVYVADDEFESAFAGIQFVTAGPSKSLAKYVLTQLESDASGRALDWETDPATVEHILPQNPSSDWDSMFDESDWEDDIQRLGNLTLLEASSNRRVADGDYSQKLAAYSMSRYETTKVLAENYPESWSPDTLRHRQKSMAARAVHVWRSDYAI